VLLDSLPAHLTVVGIEPERTEGLRIGLTASVEASLAAAADQAVQVLDGWGIRCPDGRGAGPGRTGGVRARAVDQLRDRRGGSPACR
jgi:hypothetical protein